MRENILQIEKKKGCHYFDLDYECTSIKPGKQVAVIGFPFGQDLNDNSMDLELSYSSGHISSRNKINGNVCFYLDII